MDGTKEKIKEYFQMLKESFFKGEDIDNVVNMTEAQQDAFVLQQAERLLGDDAGNSDAARLSALFWTKGEGRNRNRNEQNPLMEPKSREVMDDDERLLCSFYLTLAGLCHDLVYHYDFDTMTLGIKAPAEFYVDNGKLVEFVLNTKYERVAAHVACIMRKQALHDMEDTGYQAAYDYIKKLRWEEKRTCVKEPGDSGISPKEYAALAIETLSEVENHLSEGLLKKKLNQNVIFVHDELFGGFVNKYDAPALAAARELVHYIENTNYVKSTGQMSSKKEGKELCGKEKFLKRFEDKIAEIRSRTDNPELFGDAAMKYLHNRIEQKFFEEE